MTSICFQGTRASGDPSGKTVGVVVTVDKDGIGSSRALDPRNDLRNHSPDGFEWGYHGSGPAQLALAMLAFYLGDRAAELLYHRFKSDIIATFGKDKWELWDTDIDHWVRQL